MNFVSNARRDASPTIAGFVFQVNVTILRWLELREGEHLELECGEDLDTVQNGGDGDIAMEARLLEQIKTRSGRTITLRSEEALEALSNFCGHRVANPTWSLKFRYITTAKSGVEHGWGRTDSGIETWTALQRGRYDDAGRSEAVAALRTFLRSCVRPNKVSADAWQALQQVLASDEDTQLTALIFAFEWALGSGDYSQIEKQIVAALGRNGRGMTPDQATQAYEHLFATVFRLLCQPGEKLLTRTQLTRELQAPSATPADRAIMELVRNELAQMIARIVTVETTMAHQAGEVTALKQTVELIGKSMGFDSAFALSAVSLSTQLPDLVNPCAAREVLVDELLSRAQANGIVAVVAEPGSGKTQTLLLGVGKSERHPHWLNIPRHTTEAQACSLIDALIQLVGDQATDLPLRERYDRAAEQFRDTLVVIEDLPRVVPGGPLATRIEKLGRCLRRVNAQLLMSSYYPLPATIEQSLGNVQFDVPRFTIADVADILAAADAPQALRTEKTYQLIVSVAEGLPTLVMAAIRYLAGRNWNFTATEIEGLFRGEFAAAHRHDASSLLQITVPDPEERELLIRMSLAIGAFTMEDIASVARVPKAIRLPGEKVQRATGLWLQQVGQSRYLRSPLITPILADSLDSTTRKGVHYVLALRILARKTLDPIEAFACVNHLMMAEDVTFAVLVVIQTLTAFIELDEPIEDDFGFSHMWPSPEPEGLAEVDANLQLMLRGMQISVRTKQGRDASLMIGILDTLIAQVHGKGWGVAAATSGLAIHLVWRDPILANKYLLQALESYGTARLPDGSALPTIEPPFEQILWVSAYNCRSDAEVDSWLATISRYTSAQIDTLKRSDLMEDNVTILCDGIWMRVYRKPEAERAWGPVKEKLEQVAVTARAIGFPLLEAAAVRTLIMVLAEWEDHLDAALALSESSLNRFDADDCRFLIMEVTGRQLSYAGKPREAIEWLERALNCDAYRHSLWCRNVLITLAELHGDSDPHKAAEYTAEAVQISRAGKLVDERYIETLAEHGMALWKAGEGRRSFEIFEETANRLFAIQADTNSWKGLFARVFSVIAYSSGVALNGKPPVGQSEPKQALFLANNEREHAAYRPEQRVYICVRLAMFADGVMDIVKAAGWTWRAIELAEQTPTAWEGVRLSSWHAIPAALLSDDFVRAAQLVKVMTAVDEHSITARVRTSLGLDGVGKASGTEEVLASVPPGTAQSLVGVIPIVPIAIRLALLRFRGGTTASTGTSLGLIESVIPPAMQLENFVHEIRRALVDETDWEALWNDACRAFRAHEYVRGCVLSIGAMDKAPAVQSLYLQISIAKNFEGFFRSCPSIYREIVAPLFVAYWERTIAESTALFRTALAYTQRQVQTADCTAEGTRGLLSAMRFYLGVQLPDDAMEWLTGSI
jgi:hypothetical protein